METNHERSDHTPQAPQAPHTPSHKASRDQRIAARTLRAQGLTYSQIASKLGITQRQVHVDIIDIRPFESLLCPTVHEHCV
jgi:DNA-binding NarL/FixJ family response regulator